MPHHNKLMVLLIPDLGQTRDRKVLKKGRIPSKNLPSKSIETLKTSRPGPTERVFLPPPERDCYENFKDFVTRVKSLKTLADWRLTESNYTLLEKPSDKYAVPQYAIKIDEHLNFNIIVHGWKLPTNNTICTRYNSSMKNITIQDLIKELSSYKLCDGIGNNFEPNIKIVCHSLNFNSISTFSMDEPFAVTTYYRTRECQLIGETNEICDPCATFVKKEKRKIDAKKRKASSALPAKAPYSSASQSRLAATVKNDRKVIGELENENKKLRAQLEYCRKQLADSNVTVEVDNELSQDLFNIMESNDVTPFMKLFWEEQKKNLGRNKVGIRYHPMIIRYCLSLAAKSPSAYKELQEVLVLPCLRTLRDYKNYIRPTTGFSPEIIEELKKLTGNYRGHERFVSLLMDEMKIRCNLVFRNDELVGFIDLGDPDVNYATITEEELDDLATHALAFIVRGVSTNLKFCIAYFATKGATALQLFTLFWEAVFILECSCNLWVVAATADGASTNRRMFQMHKMFSSTKLAPGEVVYKTPNLYAEDRFIYFFSDPPHLMKTARNCLYNSGDGKRSRMMWNNGKFVTWQHITEFYYGDKNQEMNLLPKITKDHIKVTSYGAMKVKLATQILSDTTSKILTEFGTDAMTETAKLCGYMDKFFDCLNVRSRTESRNKRKPFLAPYVDVNDQRFDWLKNDFIEYFNKWEDSVEEMYPGISKTDRNKMLMSRQTIDGLKMTCNSLRELVPYLLRCGMPEVFTEKFCTDPVEEFFGSERGLGRRCDNPDMAEFGYNANTIRVQRHISCTTGNTSGRNDTKKKWGDVFEDPVPKRKK